MKKMTFAFVFLLFQGIQLSAQGEFILPEEQVKATIGISTGSDTDFSDIISILDSKQGVIVEFTCKTDQVLVIVYSRKVYPSIEDVFQIVEERFEGSKCFLKEAGSETSLGSCYQEIQKQTVK